MAEQLELFGGRHYTVADANPRSHTVKGMEMTVLRALQLIAAFEALEPGQDWTDVSGTAYRKIIGERYEYPMLLSVAWDRFQRGTLYREVLDLAANLPPASLEREEIKDGLEEVRRVAADTGRRTRLRTGSSSVRPGRGERQPRRRRKGT